LTKNFKNLDVGLLRFLGSFKKLKKPIRFFEVIFQRCCVNQSDASVRSHFPTLHRTGLIRRRISPPEPGLIRHRIRPGASYAVRTWPAKRYISASARNISQLLHV